LKPQKLINRPKFYYEGGWMQSSSLGLPITYKATERTLGDTADVTSCSRLNQYLEVVNSDKLSRSTSICLKVPAILHL